MLQPGTIIRHFKWETCTDEEKANHKYEYKVICQAMNTETNENMLIYQALYPNELGKYEIFARPFWMCLEKVNWLEYPNIKQKYRFVEIEGD